MNSSRNGMHVKQAVIDLNADLGEGFPNDLALLEIVSSASVCCNAHAGSDEVIRETLAAARQAGVVVGAHPGYRDREGFGRREQHLSKNEILILVCEQIEYLQTMAEAVDVELAFLKPHGALYNQAQRQKDVAAPIVFAAELHHFPLLGLPGTLLEAEAQSQRRRYIVEGFPERRYRADGSLVSRSEPDAILHDPAEIEAQVLWLVNQRQVATLCIHGDDQQAVAKAELVRAILARHGIAIRSFVNEPT